jgi:uncharacterized protein YfaS (alpha-2-macroglobulin family)
MINSTRVTLLALIALSISSPALAASPTKVVPEHFLRPWDPITLFFPSDRGPKNGGPEDRPERFVRMRPAHPGAFTWIDARTLQFRPAEPWPALERFDLEVEKRAYALVTLMSPPLSSVPTRDSSDLDQVETIALTFREPMPIAALLRMVKIQLLPLPGVGVEGGRWIGADTVEIKPMERRERSDPATYVLDLAKPIPLGTKAVLHFQLSLDEKGDDAFAEIAFSTAEPFRAVRMGCGRASFALTPEGSRYAAEQALRCRSEARAVQIELSSEPSSLSPIEARNFVRFVPNVDRLAFKATGRTLEVSGDFAWDTVYKVALHPMAINDAKGRPLDMKGTSELYLFFPRLPSFLAVGSGEGILERFGPKMVPLSGRGFDRVDLRIQPIDPLDRNFWPYPERAIAVDESERPPSPGEEPLPRSGPDAHIRTLGSPPFSRIVNIPLRRESGAAQFGLDLSPHLASLSKSGPGAATSGTYLVGIRKLDGSTQRDWMRVQVTDLSLSTLEEARAVRFLVTSLSSGEPKKGATVRIEGTRPHVDWDVLFSGTTDASGMIAWEAPGRTQATVRRIVVQSGDDVLVWDPARPPSRFSDDRWADGLDETWLQWTQEELEYRLPRAETLCHVFTERPVYRPEEPVHIKAYLRTRDRGRIEIAPPDERARLVIVGPGSLSWTAPIETTALGSFHHQFAEKNLPTGAYQAKVLDGKQRTVCAASFRMEAYRIPTFEVRLHAPDSTPLDRAVKLSLSGTYYAGGPVADRPVRWRVTQLPYSWAPPEPREGFVYSTDARYSHNRAFESTGSMEKNESTSDDGSSSLIIDPSIEPTAQPRTYMIEATVTGADDQTVTATGRLRALPPFVLGIKAPRYLEHATAIHPQLIVVDPDGEAIAGKEVLVRLIRRSWHSHLQASDFSEGAAKYLTDVVEEKLLERKALSEKRPLQIDLPIKEGGVYVVEVESKDRLGRAQSVSVDLYAGGDRPIVWSKPESKVFRVTADRASYAPGETANLVLQSPFQRARALAIVETPRGNAYHWIDVEKGAAAFKVEITKDEVPRVPVHFLLMRGRVASSPPAEGSTLDLGKPSTMAATTWVEVKPIDNRVEVALEHANRAQPGDTVEVKVKLETPAKKPLSGEVTLWLVDQAVLALGTEAQLDPLPAFITAPATWLSIHDTRSAAFGYLPFAETPGGDAEGESGSKDLLDRATVRKSFKTVPYYNPSIIVGPSGTAIVRVHLPDNLTNFKLRAEAVSGADRFGFATGQISVRLPVIVEPALPRFVRAGDVFEAAAIARVVEGKAGAGAAQIRANGASVSGESHKKIALESNRALRLSFPLTVPVDAARASGQRRDDAQVTVRIGVERSADRAHDAFEIKLPVEADRSPVRRRSLDRVAEGAPLVIAPVAEAVRKGTMKRTIVVSDQPGLLEMASGLDFLLEYPYGGTEQRISRARATLALKGLRESMHLDGYDDELKRAVEDTLEWLPQIVGKDGLCAYWPASKGYVWLTADVVSFLLEAKAAGFRSDEKMIDLLEASLVQALRSDYAHFIDGESFAERTYALEALARAHRFDAGYAAELARKSDYLDLESVAGVVQAFAESGDRGSATVKELDRSLWKGLIFRLHDGKEIYGGLQDRHDSRTGLILPSETRTLAEIMRAFEESDPRAERLPLLVDALITLGKGDGWGSTNANAAAMIVLAKHVAPRSDRGTTHAIEIRLGGETKRLELGGRSPIAVFSTASTGGGELRVLDRAGSVTVRVETEYVPETEGSKVTAESHGFVVTRAPLRIRANQSPEHLEGGKLELAVGDVIEERVEVVSPQTRQHVAIVVPLAGGMEPLNPALATAPPEAKPIAAMSRSPSYVQYLDDRVAFYFDTLPAGTSAFAFRTRAQIVGSYTQPAAYAEMMYAPAVSGRSNGARVDVRP